MYTIEQGIQLIDADPMLFVTAGVGLFASFVPPLNCWQFYMIGIICIVCAARAVWLSYKLPKAAVLQQIIDAKVQAENA
ncbi:MAG: hypothetical protein SPG07_02750 [Coriobacteriales bacterium]|nr:hypothetical protein [Coriobacteriaceae bacterium]MDY2722824.1 hypothetical protein [Coriobacteriales bacterium]MDY5661528.1 hypothetical protein [Coriobacteriales bacterium]